MSVIEMTYLRARRDLSDPRSVVCPTIDASRWCPVMTRRRSFALGNYYFIGALLETAVVYDSADTNSLVPRVIAYEPRLAYQP
jgi:hypothetical protein